MRRQKQRSIVFPVVLGIVVVAGIGLIAFTRSGGGPSSAPPPPPPGVEVFEVAKTDHVETPVTYEERPPVGGPHDALPQTCDFYDEPVRNENAVHSLEHGAIWITYDPDLPEGQIETLRGLVGPKVLVSPFPGLKDPVVASAWERQLRLDSASDPRLERFIEVFTSGSQSPEPLSACQGTAEPETDR